MFCINEDTFQNVIASLTRRRSNVHTI